MSGQTTSAELSADVALRQRAAASTAGRPAPEATAGSSGRQPVPQEQTALARVWDWCHDYLAADWHYNADYDRFYWVLATAIYGTYLMKLLPKLTWQQTLQNSVMEVSIVTMVVLSTAYPPAYRRHGPLLRMALLTYAYCMPVLGSLEVMQSFSPAPSELKYVGPFVDAYSLWLSTRNALLSWAMLGCRPPLYFAVPYQLFGLWRITKADFCRAPILRHPAMQARTDWAHFVISFFSSAMGFPPMHLLVPSSPELRCRSLLMFYNLVFAVVLPLVLLVPLRAQGRAPEQAVEGRDMRRSSGFARRVDEVVERCLRMLMWPRDPERAVHQQDRVNPLPVLPYSGTLTVVLRWWALVVILYILSCLLVS